MKIILVLVSIFANLVFLLWAGRKIKLRIRELDHHKQEVALLQNRLNSKIKEVSVEKEKVRKDTEIIGHQLSQIEERRQKLVQAEIQINEFKKVLEAKKAEFQSWSTRIRDHLKQQWLILKQQKEEFTLTIEGSIAEIEKLIDALDKKIAELYVASGNLVLIQKQIKDEIEFRQSEIKSLMEKTKIKDEQITKTHSELTDLLKIINNSREALDNQIKRKLREIAVVEDDLKNQKREIEQKQNEIKLNESEVDKKQKAVERNERDLIPKYKILLVVEKELKIKFEALYRLDIQLRQREINLDIREKKIEEREKESAKPTGEPPQVPPTKPESDGIPKYFLTSWSSDWTWKIGVEFENSVPVSDAIVLTQGSIELNRDRFAECRFCLTSISTPVEITYKDQKKIVEINFPLIFKLNSSQDAGQQVKKLSKGNYLIVTPPDWQWHEGSDAQLFSDTEQCALADCRLFYLNFDKDKAHSVRFATATGEVVIDSDTPLLELIGNRIPDADEKNAPLFGGDLPVLKELNPQNWSGISEIIIGEEGSGRHRARWPIEIDPSKEILNLPKEIEQSPATWFFVRIYNEKKDLQESIDFRYLKELIKIEIAQHSACPPPDGHPPVQVTFHHLEDCEIFLHGEATLPIEKTNTKTSVLIPNKPNWDSTKWEATFRKKTVEVEILLERLWWYIYDEKGHAELTAWHDTPIEIDKPDELFRATSTKNVCIKFPKKRWINSLGIGFRGRDRREFKVLKTLRDVLIPLREFENISRTINFKTDDFLSAWINLELTESEIKLLIVKSGKISPKKPDPPPDPDHRPCCNNCDHARTQRGQVWCRRYNWPQQESIEDFNRKIASYFCGEWRGEYWDKTGIYHPKIEDQEKQ